MMFYITWIAICQAMFDRMLPSRTDKRRPKDEDQ